MISFAKLPVLIAFILLNSCGKEDRDVCLEANPPVSVCCADEPTLSYCQPDSDTGTEDMPEDTNTPDMADMNDVSDSEDMVSACAQACEGATPVCDVPSGVCVGCVADEDCAFGVCAPETQMCVPCLEDGDCDGELCLKDVDVSKNICVSCLTNVDCPVAAASVCSSAKACVACQLASDCGHIAGSMQCDEGLCVGCTPATQALDCGGKVCDPTTMACTSVAVGTTLALRACAYNDQCQANHACVPLSYQGAAHGTYCMPLFSGSACGRPYGRGDVTRTTTGGQAVAVCMIKETLTTPEAIFEYETPCTVATAAVDCPATGARCEVFDSSSMSQARVCTYSCSGNNDCEPGADCIGVSGSKYCGAPQ